MPRVRAEKAQLVALSTKSRTHLLLTKKLSFGREDNKAFSVLRGSFVRSEDVRSCNKRLGFPRFTDVDSPVVAVTAHKDAHESAQNWFIRCAGVVASGALVSKCLGLVREQLVATSLGIGGLADAFNLASIFPILCLTGLGGLNGALHSATSSICGKELSKAVGAGRNNMSPSLHDFVITSNTRLGLYMGALSLILVIAAPLVIKIIAPGLQQNHAASAVVMFRLMAPVLLLSGWIGVSIGALLHTRHILAPSAVPAAGNVAFIAVMLLSFPSVGPVQLGLASLCSATAQWLLVTSAMLREGFPLAVRWGGDYMNSLFRKLLGIASPVMLTTCALNGTYWTDLAIASYVPGAAASMSYAYILGLAPFSILSGSVLTPLVRALSSYSHTKQLEVLQQAVTNLVRIMVPLAVLMSAIAPYLVTAAFTGGVFTAAEVSAVTPLIPLVQLSSVFGVIRDMLMRVHYVRNTAWKVLRYNLLLLVLNVVLDVAAVVLGLGAVGLVGSTVVLNVCACALVWLSIEGDEAKTMHARTCIYQSLAALVFSAVSWLFAVYAAPHIFSILAKVLVVEAGNGSLSGLLSSTNLSRPGAALACVAFALCISPMYLCLSAVHSFVFQGNNNQGK